MEKPMCVQCQTVVDFIGKKGGSFLVGEGDTWASAVIVKIAKTPFGKYEDKDHTHLTLSVDQRGPFSEKDRFVLEHLFLNPKYVVKMAHGYFGLLRTLNSR